MKVLVVPMSAMAETAGSFSRTVLLANALKEAKVDIAVCLAHDVNYKPINGVKSYFLSAPMPLGLPKMIAAHTFPIAQKLGITSRKSVNSFDDVLHLTGNTDYKYLKQSVSDIRNAIRDFDPDVIYSEFNISAILAGKIEKKKIFITASIPTQYEYANTPRYVSGLNKLLKEYGVSPVKSCLELFSWADKKFVPSCYELEPFQDKNAVFCGAWKRISTVNSENKNKILVYMGNGTISQKKMVSEISAAFKNSRYSVYIAGKGLEQQHFNNIQTAPYFDFQKLLPQSVLYINHGGQNSVIDGLIYGVPQLICAGKVFERKYNAGSIELLYNRFEVGKVLVIAPLRVARDTWPAEIEKWDHLKGLTYSVVIGTESERKEALIKSAGIYLIKKPGVHQVLSGDVPAELKKVLKSVMPNLLMKANFKMRLSELSIRLLAEERNF